MANFQSYALTVVIRDGELIRAYIDPLLIEDYVPHGVAGGAADLVARQAANAGSGAVTLTDGAAEVSVSPQLTAPQATGSALLRRTGLYRLADGVTASTASRSLDFGEDLLWMGSFEDQDTDASWGEGSL